MDLEHAPWQRMCAIFESALEHPLSPGTAWVHCTWTSGIFEALWAFERARHVNALPDASPFPDVGGYMAECHRRAGRFDEARACCLESLDLMVNTQRGEAIRGARADALIAVAQAIIDAINNGTA